MRISNISQYLGGADNVIAREIIEGDQAVYQFELGTQDFRDYVFEVQTQLFNSSITSRGSGIRINSLTAATPESTRSYNDLVTKVTESDGSVRKANLTIPSTLLSDLTSEHAPADVTTPFVVAMSISLLSNARDGDGNLPRSVVKQSFRMLWIVRYRPMV